MTPGAMHKSLNVLVIRDGDNFRDLYGCIDSCSEREFNKFFHDDIVLIRHKDNQKGATAVMTISFNSEFLTTTLPADALLKTRQI